MFSLLGLVLAGTCAIVSAELSALEVRTFSNVIKSGLVVPSNGKQEALLYDLNGTGVVQHMWFTMGNGMDAHTTLSFYVDNEEKPSIEFTPGVGMVSAAPEDNTSPWGTAFQGRTGSGSGQGLYSTRRIPFSQRIRVIATFVPPEDMEGLQSFFFIIRGLQSLNTATWPGPVVGGLQLPPNTKLKLYTTNTENLPLLEYLSIANTAAGKGGLLYEVYIHANSTQFLFMEACFRAFLDGSELPTFLSSGTEDYFNSANYFNAGEFRLPNVGLTYKNEDIFTMSAYRNHERDPIVFQDGLDLVWRNSDELPTPEDAMRIHYGLAPVDVPNPSWLCPMTFPWSSAAPGAKKPPAFRSAKDYLAVDVTFLVWVYEWDRE
jgi:hypothetical protein